MKCTICGLENLEGAAYCEDCGSKLPTAPPPEVAVPVAVAEEEEQEVMEASPVVVEEGVVNCPTCAAENPAGSKFCDECGAKLEGAAEAKAPAGVARLVVQDSGKEFLLDKDVITIGRQSPADGIFPDIDMTEEDEEAYISRRHARIIQQDDGFIFEDVGSSNGSFINNVRIAPGVQQYLNDGDIVRLGKTVMNFIKG